MNGQYSEKMKTGGELIVTANDWYIQYYFSGPDLRYNGTFVRLPGKEIDEYINAYRNNFKKYLEIKKNIPDSGKFETSGEKGMTIRLGIWEGVCIDYYHMPINTKEKIEEIITDYQYAKQRAITLQNMLKIL